MLIIGSIEKLAKTIQGIKQKGHSIGFVPTMGALHPGHLSLIRQARKSNDKVVVSIFVNPAQFGPQEDLKKYPRDLKRDLKMCRSQGVDIVFYPEAKEIYPAGYKTYITVESLSELLCGKFRPGHFRGVATVVAKLFNLVQPDSAYFGQKDVQQAIIIRKMCENLNFPVKIKVMPTVREKDGLAMSSRNVYLSRQQRKSAAVLFVSLNLAGHLIKKGVRDSRVIISEMKKLINKAKPSGIDYISIVDTENLLPQKIISTKDCLIALAVRFGKTRLIDNIVIRKPKSIFFDV